jgi:nucleotide-binding universal stress UspA family protein
MLPAARWLRHPTPPSFPAGARFSAGGGALELSSRDCIARLRSGALKISVSTNLSFASGSGAALRRQTLRRLSESDAWSSASLNDGQAEDGDNSRGALPTDRRGGRNDRAKGRLVHGPEEAQPPRETCGGVCRARSTSGARRFNAPHRSSLLCCIMKILVPVDGSDAALDAARHALQLRAAGLQADFVLAAVQEPTFVYEMILAPDTEVLERLTGKEGERLLGAARALFEASGVPFTTEIGAGEPAPTLLEIAVRTGCQAIIMGARGRGALSGAIMGSVSQAVLHAATMPVTIVKHLPGKAAGSEAT